MIIPVTYRNKDGTIEIREHDTGVSFGDLIPVCDIMGHETELRKKFNDNEYLEKCMVCMMERDVIIHPHLFGARRPVIINAGEWHDGEPCYECESECIVSMPLCDVRCPNCGDLDKNKHKINALIHTDDKHLLYDCSKCGKKDQIIKEIYTE